MNSTEYDARSELRTEDFRAAQMQRRRERTFSFTADMQDMRSEMCSQYIAARRWRE